MKYVLALAKKDLKLLLRDKVGFFFAFVFPVLYASLFGSIMGGMSSGDSGAIGIAVVDQDQTPGSEEFIEQLEELEELRVTRSDLDQARDWVRRGKRTAFVVLPAGFGAARERMFYDPPTLRRTLGRAWLEACLYTSSAAPAATLRHLRRSPMRPWAGAGMARYLSVLLTRRLPSGGGGSEAWRARGAHG